MANLDTQTSAKVARADAHIRLPVRTNDGHKTSVSIPHSLFSAFVNKWGGREAFRQRLNTVVLTVEPRAGYSRSQLVRLELERIQDGERSSA